MMCVKPDDAVLATFLTVFPKLQPFLCVVSWCFTIHGKVESSFHNKNVPKDLVTIAFDLSAVDAFLENWHTALTLMVS